MTQDEIRRLLGGYATNSLTAGERTTLFEAALENQELFEALQNEDALRELVDDPIVRERLRSVLSEPIRTHRPAFWSRKWISGVAIPAVAAVLVIVVMNRFNTSRPTAPPQPPPTTNIASNEVAPQKELAPPETRRPEAKKEAKKEAQTEAKALDQTASSAAPKPEPLIAAPVQVERAQNAAAPPVASPAAVPSLERDQSLTSPATARFRAAAPLAAPIPEAVRNQFVAGVPANAPVYQGPLVRYSLLRNGPANDEVRLDMTTAVAGYVALYETDASGEWRRVFPDNEPATFVSPARAYQIPANPIHVVTGKEKLRLVMIPANAAQPAVTGQLAEPRIAPLVKKTTQVTPLVVEIPLGSK
jgi:hypothetical protein